MEINEILNILPPDTTFSPDNGPFRSKLCALAVDKADEDFCELFSEKNCDIQVCITGRTSDDAVVRYLVISDQGEQSHRTTLSQLNEDEKRNLSQQLSDVIGRQSPPQSEASHIIIRRRAVEGMLDINLASRKLGFSQQVLKSKIPCTDYTYTEIEGKKEIKGYYWSHELIDRLYHIKTGGAKPEDLKYIAEECCDGDSGWAQEILVMLGSPRNIPKTGAVPPQGTARQPCKNMSREQRPPRKKQS
jgi:hypothetical protein